jgi:small ligand-binding sensory domain FIST
MSVATGLAQSPKASPQLAANAVASAMKNADITSANGVILLVTTDLLPYLPEAIRAAAKVAKTTQVFGCTATGIFTEEDWILDCPAAAALVFGGEVHLGLAAQNQKNSPLLTLSTTQDSLNTKESCYGSMTGDATGKANHVTWENAHSQFKQLAQTHFTGVTLASGLSHGLTMVSAPSVIHASRSFDLVSINNVNAYEDLVKAWHQHADTNTALPAQLAVLYADTEAALVSGHFSQTTVINIDADKGLVSLAKEIPTGKTMCWAIHQNTTSDEVSIITKDLCDELDTQQPAFGLCFSTLSRGPFTDGIDHDLNAIKKTLPSTPLIGFYGNGTIAHIHNHNQVLSNTLVLNLFK